MAKGKHKRFKENESFKSLFQPTTEQLRADQFELKGRWRQLYFKNDNPIVLELGCGKGEYTVALSKRFPEKNFIGIDIKGARLWRGAKTVTEEGIENSAFIRARIEFITSLFDSGEVDEIWITFPDPQRKKARKRLTSPLFLERYRTFLKEGAIVRLKTDSLFLHTYSREVVVQNSLTLLVANEDIYGSGFADELLSIKTFYESIFLKRGVKITYLEFTLDGEQPLKEPLWNHEPYLEEFTAPAALSRRIQ